MSEATIETLFGQEVWERVDDGDQRAFAIYSRHYSYQEYADGHRDDSTYRNRFLFVGPGEKLVLLRPDALFAWRKFIDDSGQCGVNCSVFRNEGIERASALILAAEEWAWRKWPGERLYTYVNPKKVGGTCPGYCFRRAKWRHCGETKGGLIVFEKLPG